jgi:hypothetical protein
MQNGIKNKTDLLLTLLLDANNNDISSDMIIGITRLEKMLFLLQMEKGFLKNNAKQDRFDFVPFRMGPWTNEIYDEIDFLESLGLVEKKNSKEKSASDQAHNDELFNSAIIDKYQKDYRPPESESERFSLSSKGKAKALEIWNKLSDVEKDQIISIKKRFKNLNLRQLLRYVYKNYPEYTTESEIKGLLDI